MCVCITRADTGQKFLSHIETRDAFYLIVTFLMKQDFILWRTRCPLCALLLRRDNTYFTSRSYQDDMEDTACCICYYKKKKQQNEHIHI